MSHRHPHANTHLPLLACVALLAAMSLGCDDETSAPSEAVPPSNVDRASSEQTSAHRTLREARRQRGAAVRAARRHIVRLDEQIESRVVAGSSHTCHLDEGGGVTCWGAAFRASLDPPAVDFHQIDAGGDHVCGIVHRPHDDCRRIGYLPVAIGGQCDHARGEVLCWGSNLYDQTEAPAGQYEQVSAGDDHTCAIPTGGRPIECWGRDEEGQASPPVRTFEQVVAAADHSCGLTADGEAVCWGDDDGQLQAPATRFERLSAGRDHTCGITADGEVECWGMNGAGKASAPTGRFDTVSAGYLHTCALEEGGELNCWGSNTGDVRCNGHAAGGQAEPPSGRFAAVTAGGSHSCATEAKSGQVVCWGDDLYGETLPPRDIGESLSESASDRDR